ncbi:MAG: hypothetical protein R2822_12725 [Spirosomataceae bacterium]
MKTIIKGTGSHLPERVIENSFFLNRQFMDENGVVNPKPVEEIIAKLQAITGIKSRRYISEKGDSVPLMAAAAQTPLLMRY